MGWSWAMHLCQMVTESALVRAGVPVSRHVRDRSEGLVLGEQDGLGAAAYVDNFLVLGASQSE
eukprot:8429009-Pyramimonas_sp.AAC.1